MRKDAKTSKKVTKGIFDAVKLLLENGATYSEISKYMKISTYLVTIINRSETYEEYLDNVYELSCKKNEARKAARIAAKKAAEKAAEKAKVPEKKEEPKQEEPIRETAAPEAPTHVVEHKQTVVVQATWAMTQEMQKTNKLLECISNKLAFIVDELCGTGSKGAN